MADYWALEVGAVDRWQLEESLVESWLLEESAGSAGMYSRASYGLKRGDDWTISYQG